MADADRNDANNNFSSLRVILAVLVVFSHAFPIGRGSNATEPLFALTHGQTTIGDLSVWGFFVISGFLISQSWIRSPNAIAYLKRRVARIYPAFIVQSLVCALIIIPMASDSHTFYRISLYDAADALRLQELRAPPVFSNNVTHALNGSLWSIPYEFWCYIGVLLLGVSRFLYKRYFLIVLFLMTIALHVYMEVSGWNPGGKILGQIFGYPRSWPIVLPFFLAGMLFRVFGGRTVIRKWLVLASLLLLICSYYVPHGIAVAMPIFGSYILLSTAYFPALNQINLGRYGDYSYGIYLYAFPIEQLLVMKAGGKMSPLALFALGAPCSIVVGALSWYLVERHFLSTSTLRKHDGQR